MGRWDCGAASVTFTADKVTWMPAEGHGTPEGGEFVLVSIPVAAMTRIEVDKVEGAIGIWSLDEPPFMNQLADRYRPMGSIGTSPLHSSHEAVAAPAAAATRLSQNT